MRHNAYAPRHLTSSRIAAGPVTTSWDESFHPLWVKTRSATSSMLEAELLQTIAQRVPRNSEALRGLGLVSARFAHRALDHGLFPLCEIDALRRQRRCVGTGVRIGRGAAWSRRRVVIGTRQRKVLHVERGAPAPQDGALDHVTQLADVAGPRIRQQQLARRRADLSHRLPVLGVEESQEVIGEEEHVLATLAQRWHDEDDHGEAEIEIAAESLAARLALEIAV